MDYKSMKIPSLRLSDVINPAFEIYEPDYSVYENMTFCPIKTDGIAYIKIRFDASPISFKYHRILPLLCSILSKNGIICAVDSQIKFETDIMMTSIIMTMRFLRQNAEKQLDFAEKLISDTNFFNKSKIKAVVESAVHECALQINKFGFTISNEYTNEISGILYYHYLLGLLNDFDNLSEVLCADLAYTASLVFNRKLLSVHIGAKKTDLEFFLKLADAFRSKIPTDEDINPSPLPLNFKQNRRGFSTDFNVAFNALLVCPKQLVFDDCGIKEIISSMITKEFVLPDLRNKGAYEADVYIGNYNEIYAKSTHDPNISTTYDVFNNIPEFLNRLNISENALEKYIIGALKNIDRPKTEFEKFNICYENYIRQEPKRLLSLKRNEIITADINKIHEYSDKLANIIASSFEMASFCSLAGFEKLERDKGLFCSIEPL